MELQKPFRRQFLGAWILWIMQYFSKLMKDDPQWNVKLYSENEFENVIKVVRGEKWQFYMCCILPLFSPAKLGGESDQEEKLAATLDKTFFQLLTFAKMFLSLIHTSYKKLTTILQATYRLDTHSVKNWGIRRGRKNFHLNHQNCYISPIYSLINIFWVESPTKKCTMRTHYALNCPENLKIHPKWL